MAISSKIKYIVTSIIFVSLWACHDAIIDALKPGDTLNSTSALVSASGNFTLKFIQTTGYDGSDKSFLAIQRVKKNSNAAWIANRDSPLFLSSSSLLLTLDSNYTLKITHQGGDPIVISSAPRTNDPSTSIVATLLDSGNFVLQEVNPADRSTIQIFWQSFDYPVDTFLPGMKLGVDRRSGQKWSLLSWGDKSNLGLPGPFSLDWDTAGHRLHINKNGVLYWVSGDLGHDGRFDFISPDVSKLYTFSNVTNQYEDYVTYTSAGDNPSDLHPELVIYGKGTLYDYGARVVIALAQNCDGYNMVAGCVRRNRPAMCRDIVGGDFDYEYGYFKINNSSSSSRPANWIGNVSENCKATCWNNCDCLGFDLPPEDRTRSESNRKGCRFWSADCDFIQHFGPGSNSSFVLSKLHQDMWDGPDGNQKEPTNRKWVWIGTTIAVALLLVVCILLYLQRRILSGGSREKIRNKMLSFMKCKAISNKDGQIKGQQNNYHGNMGHQDLSVFTYESVLAATSNFSQENKLGEGGFGPVYKGKLDSDREIAVKRLSKGSKQGSLEFKNELILIHELRHTNLVQLFGFCIHEEERMLIYEHMQNKSLDYYLFDSIRGVLLDWKKRFNIIEGIAQGLLYLHKYSRTRVIHRDLKATNILLDENMNPKISDFGMARIFTQDELEDNTTRIVGTIGYMAPESIGGVVSVKSDVYSFGVLILEIVTGRRNNSFYNDNRVLNLVGHAWELWKENRGMKLIDPSLGDSSCVGNQLLRCVHVGLLCVEENAADRPTMSDVLSMLTHESMQLPKPTKPAFYTQGNGVATDTPPTGSLNALSESSFDGR